MSAAFSCATAPPTSASDGEEAESSARSHDGRRGAARLAEHERAKLLEIDGAALVLVDLRDHLADVGRPAAAELPHCDANLLDLKVAAAVGVVGGEGVLVLLELGGGEEHGVAIARCHGRGVPETVKCGE